jgi:7-cyano-7-deazaguanine reductase
MTERQLPLGKASDHPRTVTQEILYPIARADSRDLFAIGNPLPFCGVDIWNAWELTWLGPGKLPIVATAEIRVPARSPNLIESKSLKLYLNAYSMSCFDDGADVGADIANDLSICTDSEVKVTIRNATADRERCVSTLTGTCLDTLPISCDTWDVDA